MSTEAYQDMRDTNAMLALVALADKDVRSGQHRPASEVLADMRRMISKAEENKG